MKAKQFSIYWCSDEEHLEDWFVVAPSEETAGRFFESYEGFEEGEATVELVMPIPAELVRLREWCDAGSSEKAIGAHRWKRGADWPSADLLKACGIVLEEIYDDGKMVGYTATVWERVFRAGKEATG